MVERNAKTRNSANLTGIHEKFTLASPRCNKSPLGFLTDWLDLDPGTFVTAPDTDFRARESY